MALFWKKQESIEAMMKSYFESSDSCFELFEKGMDIFFANGQCETFDAAVGRIHEAESAADDLRRDIELTLYGKALLPESRGDILGLLESFDRLPNRAETVSYTLRCQRMQIPENLAKGFQELLKVNLQAYYLLRKTIEDLLHNPRVTLRSAQEVEKKESASDHLERALITQIFSDEALDNGTRILLRDLVLVIGSISDRAEETSDRISIIAIKRQI